MAGQSDAPTFGGLARENALDLIYKHARQDHRGEMLVDGKATRTLLVQDEKGGAQLTHLSKLKDEDIHRLLPKAKEREDEVAKGQDAKNYVASMAMQHPATKNAAIAEKNIEAKRERGGGEINSDEAIAAAVAKRKREKDSRDANSAKDGIELDRRRMQNRSEAEGHKVRSLGVEARRLNTENTIDERTGRDGQWDRQVLTEAEKNRRIVLMQSVNANYRRSGARMYFKDQPGKVAFSDAATKLKTATNDQRVARSMAMMADAKGWKTISISGHKDFKREVWLEANLRGLEVKGYTPDIHDKQQLETLRSRQETNVIEKGADRSQATSRDATPLGREHSGPSTTARPVPAPKLDRHEGILVEHGAAKYNHDPKEKQSYFVKLETPTGAKTVWGIDLGRAMAESKHVKGDAIRLEFKGSQAVTVDALKRDEAGKVIGSEKVSSQRNAWEVHSSDRKKVLTAVAAAVSAKVKDPESRAKVEAAMTAKIEERSRTGKLPAVMVYDKNAPTQGKQVERTGPVVQRNSERTR